MSMLVELDDSDSPDFRRLRPRRITREQWDRFEGYMSEIFAAMGMPLDTPGTARTPNRFLRALLDSTQGYEGDPKLVTAFPTECRGGAHRPLNPGGQKPNPIP